MSWWERLKLWLSKWWQLALGGLVAIVVFVIGWRLRRQRITIQPTPGPSPTQVDADRKIVEDVKKLDEIKDRVEDKLRDDFHKKVDMKSDELSDSSPKVLSKPEDIPNHLKDIGNQVRNQK
jgi:hypothetical protein